MPGPRPSKKKRRERKVKQQTASVEKALQKIERRGGARVGAGRKPDGRSIAKRIINIREITDDIIRGGKVPIRTMIRHMIHYDETALDLETKVTEALAENSKSFSAEQFLEAMQLINQMGDARMKACQIASMAAPYLHPRLSAVQMQVHRVDHPRDLRKDATIEEHKENFNKLRSAPFAPILDNDTGEEVVATEKENEEA